MATRSDRAPRALFMCHDCLLICQLMAHTMGYSHEQAKIVGMRSPSQRHASGHSLAASTKTGMNATWPSTVSTTESPSTNSSLLSPSARLVPAGIEYMIICLVYVQERLATSFSQARELSHFVIEQHEGGTAMSPSGGTAEVRQLH